jgi:hypothetical protein
VLGNASMPGSFAERQEQRQRFMGCFSRAMGTGEALEDWLGQDFELMDGSTVKGSALFNPKNCNPVGSQGAIGCVYICQDAPPKDVVVKLSIPDRAYQEIGRENRDDFLGELKRTPRGGDGPIMKYLNKRTRGTLGSEIFVQFVGHSRPPMVLSQFAVMPERWRGRWYRTWDVDAIVMEKLDYDLTSWATPGGSVDVKLGFMRDI